MKRNHALPLINLTSGVNFKLIIALLFFSFFLPNRNLGTIVPEDGPLSRGERENQPLQPARLLLMQMGLSPVC